MTSNGDKMREGRNGKDWIDINKSQSVTCVRA